MALELVTKSSLEPGASFGRCDMFQASRSFLARTSVWVCRGAVWTLAPWFALVSHHPQQGEGVGGREATFRVSEETPS